MNVFAIENLMVIHFINGPGQVLLGKYRYQHKFLFINEGTGIVKLDHREFGFDQGSLYAFRTVSFVEIVSSPLTSAALIVFNTIPFPDPKVLRGKAWQLRIADNVIQLMPITSEIFEHKVTNLKDRESVAALLKIIQKEVTIPMEHSGEIILNNALNIIRMAVRVEAQPVHAKRSFDLSSSILEVMEHIRVVLEGNKKATITEISSSLNTSSYALNKRFIKDAGITLSDFLLEIRFRQ